MKAILQKKIYVGFFFILFALFSKIKSEPFEIKDFINYTKKPENNKFYAKIEVKGNNTDINYVLSAYSDSGRSKRIQLAQSINGNTKLYLSPNQIKENMFIKLECSQYPCQGNIEFSYSEKIDLIEGETLSYYVTNDNVEMEFSLSPNKSSVISNIWARGQLNINTTLNLNSSDYVNKSNYYIIKHSIDKTHFKVKGTSGDFINVGFIGYKKAQNSNEGFYISNTMLTVNESVITTYLQKDIIENVCFPIQTRKCIDTIEPLFGNGIIFTKIAYSFKRDKNGTNLDDYTVNNLFPLGSISNIFHSHEILTQDICFSFPPDKFTQFNDIKEIILTYQIARGLSFDKGFNLYEPQLNGVFYPRFLKKKQKVFFIPQFGGNFAKMTLNLMSMMGFPKMSIVDCDNYPLCELDNNKTSINKVNSSNINRFSSLSFKKKDGVEYSPISSKQTLMIVECEEGEKKENMTKYFDDICGFGTLMNKEETKIELIEDQYFNQFATKNQKDNYKIKIMNESKIDKIFIDIITYVGDVNVSTSFPDGITYSQYTSINKIYLSVKIYSQKLKELNFAVTSTSNSYYTILVNYGRELVETDSLITNELQTGFSYLVTIDPKIEDTDEFSNKIIKFRNERYIDKMPMMFSFYSLNCEVAVNSIFESNSQIKKFRHFSHHIIEPDDLTHLHEFEYRLSVLEGYSDSDNSKICKVYTSAIELSNEHEKNSRDILIPDNTPQQIMFSEKHKHVSFGYIHVDFKNDLLIKFDPQHIAQYTIKLYYENVERNKSEIIVSNDVLYLSYEKEWKNRCKDTNRVCYIQLDITLSRTDFSKNPNPVLEFSIKSISSNFVSYLPKNILTTDYIYGNSSQYFYTELNSFEKGFISINFLRGSGNVYAKVVSKNTEEENPNWRGKYKLPSSEQESLKFKAYTKKIKFSTPPNIEEKDYYLLLNVFPEVEGDFKNKKLIFPYTIFINSYKLADLNINVPLDEYVVGTIDNRIQFYSVWLNSDADKVIIDFQSVGADLYINVGNERPNIRESHFNIAHQEEDTILIISKKEILSLSKLEGISSIKDLHLTIGLGANTTETLYNTPFAFIVRLGGNEKDIYRVNSEQKALCKTKKIEGKNICLYIIEYDYLSDNNDNSLFIYTSAQSNSSISKIFAKYISKTDYEINREKLINSILTKDNSNFTSNGDYLYIKKGLPKDKYLLVSVESDIETTVKLVSSYNSNLNGVIPNPLLPQTFMVKANSIFSLNFPKNKTLMVSLRSIMGSAEIHWANDKNNTYYLKGRDDRLSVTNDKRGSNNKLLIKGTSNIQDEIGFVFYANYIFKSSTNNVEPFVLYKSVNFVYTDSDFPITLYTPIKSLDSNSYDFYEVFFSFNILEYEIKDELDSNKDKLFVLNGYITSEKYINIMRENPNLTVDQKKSQQGVYDHALRTGIIRFSKEFINSGNIENENPYLILRISKISTSNINYKRISFETTTFQNNPKDTVSELSYQFGGLEKNESSRKFLLRADKSYKYMILQFSSAEDELSVKLKDLKLNTLSDDYYGKKLYSIETKEFKDEKTVTLEIERNKKENISTTEYFMFQYTYSNSTDKVYTIKNNTIKVKKKDGERESDYFLTFNPIENHEKYNITYIIRIGGFRKNKDDKFKIPKKEYISLQREKTVVKEFYNPKGDKLNLNIAKVSSLGSYIQVLAQINDKANVEYLSYKLFNLSEADKQTKEEENKYNQSPNNSDGKNSLMEWISNNTIPFIIILSILGTILILVIILVLIVCIYHKKTKNLMNSINNVSFKKEKLIEKDEDDDDNILK